MSRKKPGTTTEQAPAEARPPLDVTPAEARTLAASAYTLAGFEAPAAEEQAARVAGLAETIDQADDQARHHLTRALLFAASAAWATRSNPRAVKDCAARAAAEFSRATLGRAVPAGLA